MKQIRTSSVEKAVSNPINLQGVCAARRTGAGSRSARERGRISRVPRLSQCAERVAAAGAGQTQLPAVSIRHQRPEMPWGRRGFAGHPWSPRRSPSPNKCRGALPSWCEPRGRGPARPAPPHLS